MATIFEEYREWLDQLDDAADEAQTAAKTAGKIAEDLEQEFRDWAHELVTTFVGEHVLQDGLGDTEKAQLTAYIDEWFHDRVSTSEVEDSIATVWSKAREVRETVECFKADVVRDEWYDTMGVA